MTNNNWVSAINQLEPEDWQIMLGPAYETLRALSPGRSICDWAIRSFDSVYPPYEIISDKDKRDVLIGKLPFNDIKKIGASLGYDVSRGDIYTLIRETGYKKHNLYEQVLLDYFGIDCPEREVREPRPLQKELDTIEYGLHDYQRQIVNDVQSIFEKGSRRLIIQMPTGSGKTRTAMYLLAQEANKQERFVALWLAYSRELCDQASIEFERTWIKHGNRPISIYNTYENGGKLSDSPIDGIVIISLQKLVSLSKKDPLTITSFSKMVDWLIFDEAHQAVAPHYEQVVKLILNSDSQRIKFIGLTATPGRTWNDPEEDRKLSDFFRKNIVSIKHDGWSSPNELLTKRGFLSKIVWKYCEYSDLSLSDAECDLICSMREEDELPLSVIEKLSRDARRNVKIINEIDHLLLEGKKRILVFCASIENARLLCISLSQIVSKVNDRGTVFEVDGATDPSIRAQVLNQFKQRDDIPRIICNYNLLTTGFDAPCIDAGVIARPTKSLVLFSQMVGRMIRGPKSGGTEYATIVSVVDTMLPGFKDSHDNWKDVWQ